MFMDTRKFSLFLIIVIIFLIPFISIADSNQFTDIAIDKSFKQILLCNSDIMLEHGAWALSDDNDRTALVGIGMVITEGLSVDDSSVLIRKGEILARKAILELGGDVGIFVKKGSAFSENKTTLSLFYQVTETQVKGHVKSMPIIGTWWSKDRNKFFVALGEFSIQKNETVNQDYNDNLSSIPGIEGREPYISLLKLNPIFCKNGGVRGFVLENNTKIIMAIASSKMTSSPVKAKKIARLKAIRLLLELKKGIKISSVERIAVKEVLVLSTTGSPYMILSEFISVQKEYVSGFIKTLPVVASWNDCGTVFVTIGNQLLNSQAQEGFLKK